MYSLSLSPSLVSLWPHTLFCCCVFLNDKTRVSSDHKIPTRSSVIFVAPSFLQCFILRVRLIRTCPNGILGRWQICMPVSVLSLFPSPFRCVVFLNACAKLVFHHNNSHTFCYFVLWCETVSFLLFVVGWSFFSSSLLQYLLTHGRSIRTCPNGILVRWQICHGVSVLRYCCVFLYILIYDNLSFIWS